MGWFLEVSAECGPDREMAEKLSAYFDTVSLVTPEGLTTTCFSEIRQDDEKNWWCITIPRGTNYGGGAPQMRADGSIRYVSDPRIFHSDEQVRQVVELLYEHLKISPPFRFATIGYESEEFRYVSDLLEELAEICESGKKALPAGLIINRTLLPQAKIPDDFIPFNEDCVWRVYGRINYSVHG